MAIHLIVYCRLIGENMFLQHYNSFIQAINLPVAKLCFHEHIDPDDIRTTYRAFTRPHPRFRLIRAKTVGAALIDLSRFADRQAYEERIKAKNHGGYHAKRARKRGYRFVDIDRNDYIDDIHAINTSLDTRQGRPMDRKYTEKHEAFVTLPHFRHHGILDPQGKLVAYASLGIYGNFAAFSQMLGYRNNDGVMHLLLVETISRLIAERQVRYVMYDTFFGAQPGLKTFKTILGFQPYRARYFLQ
ncbi:hypothetical protein [Massilia oculi]|uniref:hypothetical protein n=1 Tax=Massilia oculi TaxID=945844 RepID=UPI0028A94C1F|nr:hypothetical protein [Massilia oculi]